MTSKTINKTIHRWSLACFLSSSCEAILKAFLVRRTTCEAEGEDATLGKLRTLAGMKANPFDVTERGGGGGACVMSAGK